MIKVLTRVQIVLIVVLIALVVYIGSFILRRSDEVSVSVPDMKEQFEGEAVLNTVLPVADLYDVYANKIAGRDIFSSVSPAVSAFTQPVSESELPANLKVVGVVIGQPSEIIIEDTSARQTYFILEGQSQGGIMLQRISNGQAVLSYQGKNIIVKVKGSRAVS